jgi:hypothetical protein
VDLALALNLRKAELCLGSGVVSDHARGRTIDDLGPVLADEGGRGLNLVYGLYRGVRLPEDEAALTV